MARALSPAEVHPLIVQIGQKKRAFENSCTDSTSRTTENMFPGVFGGLLVTNEKYILYNDAMILYSINCTNSNF